MHLTDKLIGGEDTYTYIKKTDRVMNTQNIANLVLICLGVFVTGVSLTLLAPFYPSEALKKVKIQHSVTRDIKYFLSNY